MDPLRLGICCSVRHSLIASKLSARLERNLGIETLIISDDPALAAETWEQASASSAVLILLDALLHEARRLVCLPSKIGPDVDDRLDVHAIALVTLDGHRAGARFDVEHGFVAGGELSGDRAGVFHG